MNHNARHHYIPQFLLNAFATDGKAYVYRKETGKITMEPIKEMFQIRGFYSVGDDDSLERAWNMIETPFSKLCKRAREMEAEIRRGVAQKSSDGDTNLAVRAFGMQFIRNKKKLEQAERIAEAHNFPTDQSKELLAEELKPALANLLDFANGKIEAPNDPRHLHAQLHGKKLIEIPTPAQNIRYVLGGCHLHHLCPGGSPHPVPPDRTSFVMPVSPTLALALVSGTVTFRPDTAPGGLTEEFNRLSLERSDAVVAKEKEDLEGLVWRVSGVPTFSCSY